MSSGSSRNPRRGGRRLVALRHPMMVFLLWPARRPHTQPRPGRSALRSNRPAIGAIVMALAARLVTRRGRACMPLVLALTACGGRVERSGGKTITAATPEGRDPFAITGRPVAARRSTSEHRMPTRLPRSRPAGGRSSARARTSAWVEWCVHRRPCIGSDLQRVRPRGSQHVARRLTVEGGSAVGSWTGGSNCSAIGACPPCARLGKASINEVGDCSVTSWSTGIARAVSSVASPSTRRTRGRACTQIVVGEGRRPGGPRRRRRRLGRRGQAAARRRRSASW